MAKKKQDKSYYDAIKELSRDIKTNNYVTGTAQFTDLTNTDYFLKIYGSRVRYCKPWKKFLVWDKNRWEIDEYGEVENFVDDLVRNMYKGAREINDVRLRLDFESHIKKTEALRRRKALIESVSMSQKVKIRPDILDANPLLFNCKNGTIDLKHGNFNAHNPDDYITKCSNFVYQEKADCPTWKVFLLQIMNQDVELIKFVQKVMGYSMTSDVSEQAIFFLWGNGANGKSTFLNVITDLMGDYATSTPTETFMKKSGDKMSNDIARLRGMRLVTTSEAEQGKRLSEPLIKQITGQDTMTARFLYGEYFDFKPTFKIFMATNYRPVIRGSDHGIWRRIRLIPFTVTIPPEQRDKNLSKKLEEENSGILNWLLEGYVLWRKEGLENPESVVRATNEYRDEMDTVGQFLRECCSVDSTGLMRIGNRRLYEMYTNWCAQNNEKLYSQKFLAMRLQERGFRKIIGHNERMWIGLGEKKFT
jgi:putative DNA primase/helicase